MDPTIRPATDADLDFIETILAENGLPVADISEVIDQLYICEGDTQRIGVGGFEAYGHVALLRSLAVRADFQGEGWGTRMCTALIERAAEQEINELYLLTTSADGFFERFGFERIDRQAVPPSIRETREFDKLCPQSATCMNRTLGQADSV